MWLVHNQCQASKRQHRVMPVAATPPDQISKLPRPQPDCGLGGWRLLGGPLFMRMQQTYEGFLTSCKARSWSWACCWRSGMPARRVRFTNTEQTLTPSMMCRLASGRGAGRAAGAAAGGAAAGGNGIRNESADTEHYSLIFQITCRPAAGEGAGRAAGAAAGGAAAGGRRRSAARLGAGRRPRRRCRRHRPRCPRRCALPS